jgi:DNA-binding NarL/FixJ family response regulator
MRCTAFQAVFPGCGRIVSERILLADDHEILRKGVRFLLSPAWEICGEASNGQEAVQKAVELSPDLVLMDISMPVMNGIEATREIRRLGLSTKIVILSMHDSAEVVKRAKEAGANECLVKACGSAQLVKAIEAVLKSKPPA